MGWEQTGHTPRGSLGLRGPTCPPHTPPALLAAGCPPFGWASAVFPTFILGCTPLRLPPTSLCCHPLPRGSPLPEVAMVPPQFGHRWLQATRCSNKAETSFEPDSSVTVTSTRRPGSPGRVPRGHLAPRHTRLPQDAQQQCHAEPRRGPAPWLPGPLLRPHADQGRGGLLPEPLLHLGGGEDPALQPTPSGRAGTT